MWWRLVVDQDDDADADADAEADDEHSGVGKCSSGQI